jgi:anti-anti-sigma regulatory factor
MTTPFLTRIDRRNWLAELRTRCRDLAQISRRVFVSAPSVAPDPDTPAAPTAEFTVVDDPHGRGRLLGVRGPITSTTPSQLLAVTDDLDDGVRLHLDLTGASIRSAQALVGLESAIDELERRGVRLRVVGVDPAHPALARHVDR